MSANPQRGDVTVTLDGTEYTLALTHEAIVNIEMKLDTGVVAVARRFVRNDAGYRDAIAVISSGIAAAGEKVPQNLGELIRKTGMIKIGAPLTIYLGNAVSGEKLPEDESDGQPGEAKAET